jgi:hypothetical protein
MNALRHPLILAWLGSAALGVSSCGGPHPKHLDFGDLRAADRIEVVAVWDGNRKDAPITDRAKIDRAARFIERYRDGWIDVWSGPRAPWVLLDFSVGDRHVGDFGLGGHYLVAGFLSRDVDPEEIARFARDLGLKWPPG